MRRDAGQHRRSGVTADRQRAGCPGLAGTAQLIAKSPERQPGAQLVWTGAKACAAGRASGQPAQDRRGGRAIRRQAHRHQHRRVFGVDSDGLAGGEAGVDAGAAARGQNRIGGQNAASAWAGLVTRTCAVLGRAGLGARAGGQGLDLGGAQLDVITLQHRAADRDRQAVAGQQRDLGAVRSLPRASGRAAPAHQAGAPDQQLVAGLIGAGADADAAAGPQLDRAARGGDVQICRRLRPRRRPAPRSAPATNRRRVPGATARVRPAAPIAHWRTPVATSAPAPVRNRSPTSSAAPALAGVIFPARSISAGPCTRVSRAAWLGSGVASAPASRVPASGGGALAREGAAASSAPTSHSVPARPRVTWPCADRRSTR